MIELLLAAERLLATGRLDQAERLFEQVAQADPRNAIAVVGLARVAVARGAHEAAKAHARRALEIDPDDLAAAHLLESLERGPVLGSAAEPVAVAEPEPEAEAVAEPESVAEPAPVPRSWLRRLLDRLRGR